MYRVVLTLCLIAAGPSFAGNVGAWVDESRLSLTFGAFCQQTSVGEVPAPDTHAQKIDLLSETPEIRWATQRIPAVPGISFGIRSESHDEEILSPVLIELIHPPFRGIGTTRQSYLTRLGGDGASINAYSFDLPEEMVPGVWTFTAWQDGAKLYEVSFDVVPASQAPEIAGGCDGYLGA